MYINVEYITSIKLTLNAEEALWLKLQMQNAKEGLENESSEDRAMRMALFDALPDIPTLEKFVTTQREQENIGA